MARWLDGRVTAVIGTHTHVQTNDARVQPGGTAAITDAGMTGPHDSVIGVKAELAIERMRTGMPVRFEPADGDVRIEGVLVECDADGPGACERAEPVPRSRRRRSEPRQHEQRARRSTRSRAKTSHDADVVEVLHEVPVADREPELGQHEREPRAARSRSARAGRATSGTSGISQIRNCGDSTLPNATKATTDAAQ